MPQRLLDNAMLEKPPVCIPLTGGLIGAPVPATKAAPGLRIANNIRNSPGNRSIERQPGWQRTIPQQLRDLTQAPLDNTSVIYCTAGDPAMGLHGTSFYKVDNTLPNPNARVQWLGNLPSLAPERMGMAWNPGATPVYCLSAAAGIQLGRLTAHEYATPPVAYNGSAYMVDKYSVPLVASAGVLREAVPHGPTRKFVLCAAGDFNAPCNFIHSAGDDFTSVGTNSIVANDVSEFPTWGTAGETFNRVTVKATTPNTALCYRNTDFTFRDTGRIHANGFGLSGGGGNMETGFYAYRWTYLAPYTKPIVFAGVGLNDFKICECPDSWTTAGTVIIKITATGAPDHFEYSTDGGATWSAPIAITGGDQPFTISGVNNVVISNFTGAGPNDMAIQSGNTYTGVEPANYLIVVNSVGAGPSVKRVEDLTFTGQPADGETFTVGGVVFTFKAVPGVGQIGIGAGVTDSIDNAVTVVTAYTPAIAFVATNQGGTKLRFTANVAGTGTNAIVFSEAIANATFAQTTAGSNGTTDTVHVSKNGGAFGGNLNMGQIGDAVAVPIGDGITVDWSTTAGHGLGDHWKISASPGQVLCFKWLATTGHTINDQWTVETIIQESLAGDPSRICSIGAGEGTQPVAHVPIAPHKFVGRRGYRTGPGLPHTLENAEISSDGTGNVPVGGHKWVCVLNVPGIGECPSTKIADDPSFNGKTPVAYRLKNLPVAFFPAHPEIEAMCTRDFYRADDISSVPDSTTTTKYQINGTYRYVGTIANNTETEFIDNVAPENMGKTLTFLEDLDYYLVKEFLDNTSQSFDDTLSSFSMGVKLSRNPQPINHTRVRLWFRYDTTTVRPGLVLDPNSIGLVFSSATALSDQANWKVVPINQPTQAGPWYLFDFDWSFGEFMVKSYGFVLIQRDKNWSSDWKPIFSVGQIQAVNGEYGPFVGEVEVKGAWFQREPLVQSDPNLPSNPISISADRPHGLMLLTLGYRGFNSNQVTLPGNDPVGINLPPRTTNDPSAPNTPKYFSQFAPYISLLAWGKDAFGRGLEYHLASENVNYPGTSSSVPADYESVFVKIGNNKSPFLGQPNSYTVGGAALDVQMESEVAKNNAEDLAELRAGEQLVYVRGRGPATDQAVLDGNVQVFGPEFPFSVGAVEAKTYFDLLLYDIKTFKSTAYQTTGAGLWDPTITGTYSGAVRATYTLNIVDATHFKWKKDSGGFSASILITGAAQAISDGLSVTWGAVGGHTAGDEGIVTVGVSRCYDWMVGRNLTIGSEDRRYMESAPAANNGPVATETRTFTINQVIERIVGGASQWWLRIGAAFNGATAEFEEAFYGEPGTYPFVVQGGNDAYYSTESSQTGARPDYVAVTNKIKLPFQSDQYIAVGRAGARDLFFGKNSVYYTLQNRGWDDQTGAGRFPLPQLVQGAVGTECPRTVINTPSGELAYWSTNQRLAFISAGGFRYFEIDDGGPEVSERYKGWLDANTDPELARFSFAAYNQAEDWIEIYFIKKDAVTDCFADGTTYDFNVAPTDFYYRLVFDLRYKKVYTGDRFNLTAICPVGADCTNSGEQHGRLIAGDQYGYVNAMDQAVNAGGVASATITYAAQSYVSATRVLTVTAATLPTAGAGISNIVVGLQNPVTFAIELVEALSNTNNTITLRTNPVNAPAAGWIIRLGPIICTARSFENIFVDPAAVELVTMATFDGAGAEASRHEVTVYAAQSDQLYASGAVVGQTRSFTVQDLQHGWGMIPVERGGSSRALMIQDKWIQGQGTDPTYVLDFSVVFDTGEEEPGRDYLWPSKQKISHR